VATSWLLPVCAEHGSLTVSKVAFCCARAPVRLRFIPSEWGLAVCDFMGVSAEAEWTD
jgi:hypothetical protein